MVAIPILAIALTRLSWGYLKSSSREQALLLLSSLDWAVAPLASENDIASIQRLFENIGGYPVIRDLRLYDATGRIIASNHSEESGTILREPIVEEVFQRQKLQSVRDDFDAGELSAAEPVRGQSYARDRRSDITTALFLRTDVAQLKRRFLPFTYAMMSTVLVSFLAVLALFSFFLYRWILIPLRSLSDAVSNVSGGNYNVRSRTDLPGELGRFAGMFNSMLEEIRQNNRDLKDYSQELENRVESRMRSVREANAQLEKAYTDLKNAQIRLLQSDKMASIGQLAAGIAHEINNPNSFIMSNLVTLGKYMEQIRSYITGLEQGKTTQALRANLDIGFILEDFDALAKESLEGTQRVEAIVHNLRDFAHIDQGTVDRRNVNELLDNTLQVVRNEIKYKATVEKEYGNVPPIRCYPQRLNQVFLNLLVNAAQAIESNGLIRISTSLEDGFVVVRIRDNGCGIPVEIQDRIFEPFFTTKDIGKGTGLGLAIVYDIIHAHKGRIEVESEPGKGTEFTIRLKVEPELEEKPGGKA